MIGTNQAAQACVQTANIKDMGLLYQAAFNKDDRFYNDTIGMHLASPLAIKGRLKSGPLTRRLGVCNRGPHFELVSVSLQGN